MASMDCRRTCCMSSKAARPWSLGNAMVGTTARLTVLIRCRSLQWMIMLERYPRGVGR